VPPAKRLLALLLALAALSMPAALAPGALAKAPAPNALAPLGAPVRARAAAAHGPTVSAALASLLAAHAITQTVYAKDYAVYVAAKRSVSRLTGTRRSELAAVLANVQAMAAAGELIASRQAVMFLTLEKNEYWWTQKPLLEGEVRVSFPPSELVWEHYPGQGIEIQWLATFGEGNGYYLSGEENSQLKQLVSEVIPLATQRAGGIAWEYMFRFDGGMPPWTSGLSQGTALQVLARAGSRFKEAADLTAAQQALGIFQTPPPQGVRVATAAGARYAEYTFAPSDRILNGFIQAVVGLYDYTQITREPLGLSLFEAGDAVARVETPHYDTGYWSMYDQYGESDLNYHELLTEFLQHLCERTRKGPPLTPTAAPPPSTPTTTTPTTPSNESPDSGGVAPTARAAQASTQIAGDQIYCTTAEHFSADLHTPPLISLLSTTLHTSARAGVQVSLSKISTVTLTVRRSGKVIWTNTATIEGGKPRLLWVTPSKAGSYSVTLLASDLAGNFATATGTVVLVSGSSGKASSSRP
jgi:hypothetical protein